MRVISLALLGCLSSGCVGNLDLYRYDNPELRILQERTTNSLKLPEPDWSELVGFIGDRVAMITPESVDSGSVAQIHSGRGAALTKDGYFLTAYHVVEDGPFAWHRFSGYDQMQPGRVYTATERAEIVRQESHPGRLVWSNSELDLAIVKFEVDGLSCFDGVSPDTVVGETVYSVDDKGVGLLRPGASTSELLGNGSFVAAGRILKRSAIRASVEGSRMSTSLVGRGGMSGAPVVTQDRKVCGILIRCERYRSGEVHGIATMISPATIRSIIAGDRRIQRP